MDIAGFAANQGVPIGKGLAMGDKAVAAAMGQPVQRHHIVGRYLHAIGHVLLAVGVIRTLVRFQA